MYKFNEIFIQITIFICRFPWLYIAYIFLNSPISIETHAHIWLNIHVPNVMLNFHISTFLLNQTPPPMLPLTDMSV